MGGAKQLGFPSFGTKLSLTPLCSSRLLEHGMGCKGDASAEYYTQNLNHCSKLSKEVINPVMSNLALTVQP